MIMKPFMKSVICFSFGYINGDGQTGTIKDPVALQSLNYYWWTKPI